MGWIRHGIPQIERVADHRWRIDPLCFLLYYHHHQQQQRSNYHHQDDWIDFDLNQCVQLASTIFQVTRYVPVQHHGYQGYTQQYTCHYRFALFILATIAPAAPPPTFSQ
jgi:hypothetical protein